MNKFLLGGVVALGLMGSAYAASPNVVTGTVKAIAVYKGNPVMQRGTWTFCKSSDCFSEQGGSTKQKALAPGDWVVKFQSEGYTGQRTAFVRGGSTNNVKVGVTKK